MRLQYLFKLFIISLISFAVKIVSEMIIEWSNIMPLRVRAHFFGDFLRSAHYIWYDFIVHFWLYILGTFLLSVIIRYSSFNIKYIIFSMSLFLLMILLYQHNFKFPKRQYYFPSEIDYNYKFIEEFLIYSLSIFTAIYLIMRYRLYNRNKM